MSGAINSKNELELRKFVVPEFIYGAGARFLAGRYAKNYGARKVLIVTDPGIIKAGWTDQVVSSLEMEGLSHIVFSQVTPNPRVKEVMAGAQVYKEEGCNVIIAVGGGSPMDCAKGIGIAHTNKRNVVEFEGVDRVQIPGPPLICIPATAGSSADVSQFAIISDQNRKVKFAIVSKTVVPDAALIDPTITITMDTVLTANTGIDAFSHAIEAYVSNANSPITDLHALEAIRLVTGNLSLVMSNLDDLRLRGQMMLASLHAGIAFSNASLGAVHALSHSLGGLLDIPHGESNGILLEHVIAYNFDSMPERYLDIGKAMGLELKPGKEKENILGAVRQLCSAVGIDKTLKQVGVSRDDIPKLAEKALHDVCMVTNPRRLTQQDVEVIYESAL